jgi:hypothetical protein
MTLLREVRHRLGGTRLLKVAGHVT